MNDACNEYDRVLAQGPRDGEAKARWRDHLRSCAACRAQVAADAVLRVSFAAPPPVLSTGFEVRLRRQIEGRRARAAFGRWRLLLAGYVTVATVAAVWILSHLPWDTVAAPRGSGAVVLALMLASPLVLLGRSGFLRPPG